MVKAFSWSYSKAKNFTTCPKRHYEVDLAKNFTEDSEQLTWGNAVHSGLAAAVLHHAGLQAQGAGRDKIIPAPLPDNLKEYQGWIDVVTSGNGNTLLVERQYAITKDFQSTSWFAKDVWFRSKVDFLALKGNTATAFDWKTGKIQHDSRQLMLSAQTIFVHHPEIDTVKTRFLWLKDGCSTPEVYKRDTIHREWPPVLELVKRMEKASDTMDYPPNPNRLCAKYCPVTTCEFHGKRHS